MSANPRELISHFAIILPVSDMDRSISFYRDQLGFDLTFEWNDPTDYAVLTANDQVAVHLSLSDVVDVEDRPRAYFFVQDADEIYKIYKSKSVNIPEPVEDRDYGMRDFDVIDPDGHVLSFGKGI